MVHELEQRLKELSRRRENLRGMKDHLRGEYEEIDTRLRASRREFRDTGLTLHRSEGRDLKLVRHALETVTSAGTVVAVVSGRNLLRPQSVRALRSYLTPNQNWLDTVIELPRGVAGAGERVALLVFRKGRSAKDVLFVDASRIDAVVKAGSEDSGVDIAAPDSLFLRRQRVEELPEPYVARLVEIIRDRVEYDGVSAKVELTVVPGESVDLRPQQYLRSSALVRVTVEKLHQKLAASVEQTRKASAALQTSRAALGLPPLNPQSGPAAPRPLGN
jgi:type I restriction-modification system DNA methylase subunit